jgi:hypothetical protein
LVKKERKMIFMTLESFPEELPIPVTQVEPTVTAIPTLFKSWVKTAKVSLVYLLDHTKHIVGALYLNHLDLDLVGITETTTAGEKYLLYLNGVAIYFTYYRKAEY